MLFKLVCVFGLLWGLQLGLATPTWAQNTCPNGSSAPCAEDVQVSGCTQCHSMVVVGGNRNGTDRRITSSTGSNRHVNDPRLSDWTSNVASMISKGAPSDQISTSGYLNTNYCTTCTGPILGSPLPSNTTETAANVTWGTSANGFEDEPTDTVLFYGINEADVRLGPSCSGCQKVSNATLVAHHVVNLTGLTAGTRYFLVNQATSSRGTVLSKYAVSFKTKAPAGGGPAIPSFVYFSIAGHKVGVIDPATNTQIATISSGNTSTTTQNGELAQSLDGTFVYALDAGDLLVIDVLANKMVAKVLTVADVWYGHLAVSPNGSKVYTTQGTKINVIDTSTNLVVDNIPLTGATGCDRNRLGLGIHPSGSPLYLLCSTSISSSTSGTGYFYLIDPVTKQRTLTYQAQSYAGLTLMNRLGVKPDGTRVYAIFKHTSTSEVIEVLNGVTGARVGTVTLSSLGATSVVVKPDGTRLYTEGDSNKTLYVIDAVTNSILTTVTLPAAVLDIAITPDGGRLYATSSASVFVINTATNTLTNTIPTGSNTGPITVSLGRAGVSTPDLLITSLTANGSPANAGNTLSVTDAVKNQGQASTGDSFTIAYRLSRTANYDDPSAGSVATIRAVGALAAGATDQITTSLLLPLVTPGAYFVCAKADPPDDILESDETNNTLCSASTVQINSPDLVMTLESPKSSSVPAGQVLVVTDTVRNQGGASTGVSFTIGYRLSRTANYDDPSAGSVATIRAVGALAAGVSETADRALLISTTVAPGTYFVCAKADAAEGISENNESNNTLCSTSTVSVQ